ncbi:hypothetical protein V8C42DRAFT_333783 [Trichoderma barbatum]
MGSVWCMFLFGFWGRKRRSAIQPMRRNRQPCGRSRRHEFTVYGRRLRLFFISFYFNSPNEWDSTYLTLNYMHIA